MRGGEENEGRRDVMKKMRQRRTLGKTGGQESDRDKGLRNIVKGVLKVEKKRRAE